MIVKWKTPYYKMITKSGTDVEIDVTLSNSPSLPPNKLLLNKIIPFFRENELFRVVDYGSGSLRHTIPLLKAGFEVSSVDFESIFSTSFSMNSLDKAKRYPNFHQLFSPEDFQRDRNQFDAALLCYVIQCVPNPKERDLILKMLYKKLCSGGIIFYMSSFGLINSRSRLRTCGDGYFTLPMSKIHGFYREFNAEETHNLFKINGFKLLRSLGIKGSSQAWIYQKVEATSNYRLPKIILPESEVKLTKKTIKKLPVPPGDYFGGEIGRSENLLRVFLCHASEDKSKVKKLWRWLRDSGYEPWLDVENLYPGTNWQKEIVQAVRASHIVLVCLSKRSINKRGYVQKEIRIALDAAEENPEGVIYIIPVRLEKCDVPDVLEKWQWVDLWSVNGYSLLRSSLQRRLANIVDSDK